MKTRYIIGIDEVGRGPLAGPVTLCACAIPQKHIKTFFDTNGIFFGVKDSKKLSPARRQVFFMKAKNFRVANSEHLSYALSHVSAAIIDKRGISKAIKIAIKRCLQKLSIEPADCQILLDGSLKAPVEFANQKTIIRGDALIPIISLASVIAKVTRDKKMIRLARQFPGYSFEIHKGYGTKIHQKALRNKGLCHIHRKTFIY